MNFLAAIFSIKNNNNYVDSYYYHTEDLIEYIPEPEPTPVAELYPEPVPEVESIPEPVPEPEPRPESEAIPEIPTDYISIYLDSGWNLIGHDSFATIYDPDNIVSGSLYSFDNGAYTSTLTLEPYKGYFIKINTPGYIYLQNT